MPGFRILKHSGIHRFATCSLFRTLLRGIRHKLIPDHARNTLAVAIKDKFHRSHHAQGHYIHDAMAVGHRVLRVLSTLQNSSELPQPVTRLIALVSQLYPPRKIEKIQWQRSAGRRKLEDKLARQAEREAGKAKADAAWHVYDRPMPKELLTGMRKIPNYVTTSGYPFLRYAKPQTKELSGMLRYKADRRMKLARWMVELEDSMDWARDEDQWEGIITGIVGKRLADNARYVNSIYAGIDWVKEKVEADNNERNWRAEKLFGIHLQEKELALQENAEAKRERRRARRNAQKGKQCEQETALAEVQNPESDGATAEQMTKQNESSKRHASDEPLVPWRSPR